MTHSQLPLVVMCHEARFFQPGGVGGWGAGRAQSEEELSPESKWPLTCSAARPADSPRS